MRKSSWLCEPAGWDARFLGAVPRLTPFSCSVPRGRATVVGRMPRAVCRTAHDTRLPGKGSWAHHPQSPPMALRGVQARWATPRPAAPPPAPTRTRAVLSMWLKTWLPVPALPGDWFGPRQWKRSVILVIWWESPLLLAPWFLSREWARFGRSQEDPRPVSKQPLRWERLEDFASLSCSLPSLWLCGRRGKICFPCSKQQQKVAVAE